MSRVNVCRARPNAASRSERQGCLASAGCASLATARARRGNDDHHASNVDETSDRLAPVLVVAAAAGRAVSASTADRRNALSVGGVGDALQWRLAVAASERRAVFRQGAAAV